jgi:hypothetical protein
MSLVDMAVLLVQSIRWIEVIVTRHSATHTVITS